MRSSRAQSAPAQEKKRRSPQCYRLDDGTLRTMRRLARRLKLGTPGRVIRYAVAQAAEQHGVSAA